MFSKLLNKHVTCHMPFETLHYPWIPSLVLVVDPKLFQDPELAQLARALPQVLIRDRAPKTVEAYIRAYRTWKRWAERHKIIFLPADIVSFALYLVVSTVNSAVYGVSWVHKKSGYQEPAEHPLIKQIREGAKRILARPAGRKTPLEADLVERLIERLEKGNLLQLQLAVFIALGFYGFLRWDDLSNLTVDRLQFESSHLAVFLERRKNNQFREGSWVMFARSKTNPCPVHVVHCFIAQGGHDKSSMTYSRANQLLKMELQSEGLDGKSYGIHSLRAGGASAAAALGVPDQLFQRQGGWRSEKAQNNYFSYCLLQNQCTSSTASFSSSF